MGLKDDSKKIRDGELLTQYRDDVQRYAAQIDIELSAMKAVVASYGPQERAEADADIAVLKTTIQTILGKY
jgi:hypothetical protein